MVAIVTLRVNDCRTGSAISGASVTDGYNIVYTNAYGEIAVYWDNTVYAGYGVSISKSGYQTRPVNLYNSQNGTTVTTCLDPASTGGGGSSGGGSSSGGGISCFIVTAATGSPLSEEVNRLRGLRDEIAARSQAAGTLIDAIYGEYWQFSPALASRIDADGLLRNGALLGAVRPLLAWYGAAAALAMRSGADPAIAALRGACVPVLPAEQVAGLVARIRKEQRVPSDAPAALHDVAGHLVAATRLPLVDWAILWPLETCWRLASGEGEPQAAIAAWLAAAPTEPLLAAGPAEARIAADLLAFDPAARTRLLNRLGLG